MKSLLALLLLTIAASQSEEQPKKIEIITFEQFKLKYGYQYASEAEDKLRESYFNSNVTNLLSNPCQTCGITKFYASTQLEIDAPLNLLLPPNIAELAKNQQQKKKGQSFIVSTGNDIRVKLSTSSSLDWRERDVMTPSKRQGDCGTCWSFTTVGMCESSLILQGRAQNTLLVKVDLSEQYLLKCTFGSSCNGGYLENSIDKALTSGLPYESEFPYSPFTSNNNGICATRNLVKISNKTRVSKYYVQDDVIIEMLQDGPISVAVSATGWQSYAGGVFKCKIGSTINHAVVIAGYTEDSWIIKNSWGTDFGDNGYIYITRDKKYNCGIGTAVHSLNQNYVRFALMILLIVFAAML